MPARDPRRSAAAGGGSDGSGAAAPLRLVDFAGVERELERLERLQQEREHQAPGSTNEADPEDWLAWALAHCAQSIELSLSGFPRLWPRLLQATVGRLVKRRFLGQGFMSHNLSAPVPGAAVLEETEVMAGLTRLRRAIAAFREHRGELAPHPVYGPCTREQLEQLHAMHVANHLSDD